MPHKTTVKTNGQALTVNASVSHWTTEALALTASAANDVESTTTTTITADYDLWFANTATTATVTVKQLDGTTLATYTDLQVNPGVGRRVLSPVPDIYQVAAASADRAGLALAPTGAIAETFGRNGFPIVTTAVLTSGTMYMQAIDLEAGQTVTSITVMAGSQAAVAPTAQWFALYNADLTLIGQTTNDTSTAWAAYGTKTLAFSSPVTTTKAGRHYIGVLVVAGTVPSLMAIAQSGYMSLVAPALQGTSDAALTTTAPATATAISAQSPSVWAYLK